MFVCLSTCILVTQTLTNAFASNLNLILKCQRRGRRSGKADMWRLLAPRVSASVHGHAAVQREGEEMHGCVRRPAACAQMVCIPPPTTSNSYFAHGHAPRSTRKRNNARVRAAAGCLCTDHMHTHIHPRTTSNSYFAQLSHAHTLTSSLLQAANVTHKGPAR